MTQEKCQPQAVMPSKSDVKATRSHSSSDKQKDGSEDAKTGDGNKNRLQGESREVKSGNSTNKRQAAGSREAKRGYGRKNGLVERSREEVKSGDSSKNTQAGGSRGAESEDGSSSRLRGGSREAKSGDGTNSRRVGASRGTKTRDSSNNRVVGGCDSEKTGDGVNSRSKAAKSGDGTNSRAVGGSRATKSRDSSNNRLLSGSDSRKAGDGSDSSDSAETICDEDHSKTYIIGKFLGKGAHARVYEACDQAEPTQQYALKFMTLEPSSSRWVRSKPGVKEVRLNQVLREVEIHGLMQHTNIVKLESYFQQDARFCIVLEHCEGNNLAHLLENIGHMGEANSRNLLNQLVDGLEHIHNLGVIHRDLKPANIYLTRQMVIKIGDFGLADRVGSGRKGICGTPNYISPEALMEQGYTPAVDIWALGCIAYHMLAGKPPFDAASHSATYELIRAHKYSPLLPTQAGAGARHLVHWMLSFLPQERPTLPSIRSHVWMKRRSQKTDTSKTWSKRKARRRSAPIAQKLNEISTSSSESTVQDLKYERLCEKVSETSLKEEVASNKTFWRTVLEKVKLKKAPSFHFLPSTLFNIKNKDIVLSKGSSQQYHLKLILGDVLRSQRAKNNPDFSFEVPPHEVPVFVAKWIDYSNKFGFGYQMTDGTTGVLFNDKTQICLDGSKMSVTYSTSEERTAYPLHSVPSSLTPRLTLLENFKEYMDTQLCCGAPQHAPLQIPPMLTQWTRGDKAIVFHRADLLQVNFIADHFKLLFYHNGQMQDTKYSLLSINSEKMMRKYDLIKLRDNGCPELLLEQLTYVHSVL